MSELGKTLIVTGGGLGDTLFHLPFIRSIQQRSTGKSVVLACKKGREISELFSEVDMVSTVLPIARDQDVSGKADLRRLRNLTKAAGIESAFVFHKSTSIAFAMMMAGVKKRYGYFFKGAWNRFFLNKGTLTPKVVPLPAFMNHAALVMDEVGIPYDYSDVQFRQPDHVVEAAFSKLGLDESTRMIALGVNASAEFKQWGVEGYSEIAERLLKIFSGQILLFGAGDVKHVSEGILAKTSQPERFIDLTTKKVPLHHSHALLQKCDFYIGNDSFGLNLAAMSSIAAVGIFIKSYYFSYSNWIKPIVSSSDHISGITPDMVWKEASQLIAD